MENLEGVPIDGRPRRGGKFDIRFVQLVLKEVAEGLPLLVAASKYKLSIGLIRTWNRKYGQHELPVLRRTLPLQQKRTLLRAVAAGKLSVREAAVTYGVGESSIHGWLKQYTAENDELGLSNVEDLSRNKKQPQANSNSDQIHQLQQQLADAQLKIAALNTLIDVAEEQLKINIRKKPGARQS